MVGECLRHAARGSSDDLGSLQDQVSQSPHSLWTHQDHEGQVPQSEARWDERH
jgi:hypothetical protein